MIDAVLVANVHSRRSSASIARAHELLARHGVRVVASHTARDGEAVAALVRAAIDAGAPRVLVGGGDGTMTRVVGAFAHTAAVLGVLPFGTGNSFAASLGIGDDLEGAVRTIAAGRIARVDLGIVNGKHFANFATIGLPSIVSRATSPVLKNAVGPLAYVLAGIAPFVRSRPFACTVTWGEREARIETRQIVVASGSMFGKKPLVPGKTIVDGNLAFFTTTADSHLDVARAYLAMYRGTQTALGDAFFFTAPEIVVRTKPKQKLDVDGAKLGKTPARFSVDPRALHVFVPAAFSQA